MNKVSNNVPEDIPKNVLKKLPNYEKASIPDGKITKYLLNIDHKKGKSKAKFFLNSGFTLEQWHKFAEVLCLHPVTNDIVDIEKTNFGMKYVVECNIVTPNGCSPCIRSVWIIKFDSITPLLVTAYPF
jgi:hypothetical protein